MHSLGIDMFLVLSPDPPLTLKEESLEDRGSGYETRYVPRSAADVHLFDIVSQSYQAPFPE